jgi:hypothetical protein
MIFLIGISFVFISLYSRYLSVIHMEEKFFLHQLIGPLSLRGFFILGIIFIFFSFSHSRINDLVSPYTLRVYKSLLSKYGDYVNTRQIEISIYTYIFFLSLLSILIFILFGKHTAFEWVTTADIPLILRLIDPNFLQNDFYTNSLVESARFIFPYIIYGFTKLGMHWLNVLYFFKITLAVIINPLLFLLCYNIWLRWKPRNLLPKDNEIIKIFFLLFCLFGGKFFYYGFLGDTFGWVPIQTVNAIAPMTVSLVIGMIYNIISFNQGNFKYFSPFLLLLSVLIHPVVGLFHFFISAIFLLPISLNIKTAFQLLFDFLIGIVPVVLFFIYYKSRSSIDAATYIDIYIYLRHPHHYLISEIVNGASILLVFFFLIPLYYSFKIKQKKYFVLSFLIFISIFLGPFIQFLGTQVWKIKAIAEIGPTRYSSFASILWILNIIIVGAAVYKTSVMKKDRWLKKISLFFSLAFLQNIIHIFQIIFFRIFLFFHVTLLKIKLRVSFCFLLIFLTGTFWFTHKHPLEYYGEESKLLIKWISKNSTKDSVFFVRDGEFDSFLVRVYAERAIFADGAFPFNDNFITEFKDRFLIYKKSNKLQPSDYACLQKHFTVDYLIVPSKVNFANYYPLFLSTKWAIYDISKFKANLKEPCNIKQLVG